MNDEPAVVKGETAANGAEAASAQQQVDEDEDDDKPLLASYKMSRSVRKGVECPYLDTISRQVGLLCACILPCSMLPHNLTMRLGYTAALSQGQVAGGAPGMLTC